MICLSCPKDNSEKTYGTKNLIEDLDWLKEAVGELQDLEQNKSEITKYSYVQKAEYNLPTIFIFGNGYPFVTPWFTFKIAKEIFFWFVYTDFPCKDITHPEN